MSKKITVGVILAFAALLFLNTAGWAFYNLITMTASGLISSLGGIFAMREVQLGLIIIAAFITAIVLGIPLKDALEEVFN